MDLPGLLYFQNGGVFKGSKGNIRFIIKPIDEKLLVQTWQGPYCYEKSEMEDESQFELNDNGRGAMQEWLTEKLQSI